LKSGLLNPPADQNRSERFPYNPYLLLAVQSVLLLSVFLLTGRVQYVPDSDSYLLHDFGSLNASLSGIRTFAYPFFLKAVHYISRDFAALPAIQMIFHIIAVFLFAVALRIYGFSKGLTVFAASPLLYLYMPLRYSSYILSDAPACSLAVITISLLLMIVANPRGRLLWFAFCLSLFLAYQTRPALLFLTVLTPVLGALLKTLRINESAESSWKKMALYLSLASFVPLFLFCFLRLAVVGQFSLVSFDGYNLSGITSQFLTEEKIPQLPANVRVLAAQVQHERRTHDLIPGNEILGSRQAFFEFIETHHGRNVYEAALNAAEKLYGTNNVVVNEKMMELSAAVIKNDPGLYAKWLMTAFLYGLGRCITFEPVTAALILILCFSFAALVWKVARSNRAVTGRNRKLSCRFPAIEVCSFGLLASGYFFTGLSFILLEPPIPRYINQIDIFIPSFLTVLIYFILQATRDLQVSENADPGK
jgi:hypothetical protein